MLSRSGWVLTALAALSTVLCGPEAMSAASSITGPDFPQALLSVATLLQLTISLWVLTVVALSQLSGTTRIVRAVTPAVLRRGLFVGAVGALAIAPAQADRGVSPAHSTVQDHSLDGLRLPDRPPTSITEVSSPQVNSVVVNPGDTLWAIAARSLPPGASDADIARACSRWYAVNRAVIGDDPDLIHPSQHLNPPPTKDPA